MVQQQSAGRKSSNLSHKVSAVRCLALCLFFACLFLLAFVKPVLKTIGTPGLNSVAAQSNAVVSLQPEHRATFEISPAETQMFKVDLKKADCLRLSIDKQDLHLSVTIQDPHDRIAAEFLSRRYGTLNIFHIASETGQYVVQVQSLEKDTARYSYSLTLQRPAQASPSDHIYESAIRLANEADFLHSQWEQQPLRDAITKYSEASRIWQTINRHEEAAQAFTRIGDIYSILSDYKAALSSYEQALKLRQTADDRNGEADSLNDIGYAYCYLGNTDRALEYLTRVLRYSEPVANDSIDNTRRLAQTLNNIGEVYYAKSDVHKSREYFNRALDLWTKTGDRSGQALAFLNIGYSYYDSGDYQQAATYYQRSLTLRQGTADQRGEALALTALGGIYSILGEKQLALDSHNTAMQSLRKIGDHLGEAAALNGVGRAYEDLNQSRTALDKYIGARDLFHRAGKTDYEAISNYYVGRVYRSLGDVSAALASYQQCIDLSVKAGNGRFRVYALKEIAIIHNSTGDQQKALELFGEALKFYQSNGDKRGEAYALSGIGYTHLVSNNPSQAIKYFEVAIPLSRSVMDRSAEVTFLYYAALAERSQDNLNKALEHIKESIQLIENMRTKVISRDLRVSYFASLHEHYEFYIELLMELDKRQPNKGYASAAFEVSEQARARSLLDSLMDASIDFPQDTDPLLASRLRELRKSLNARAEYQMRLLNGPHSPEAAEQVNKEIRELTADYNQTEAQLRRQSTRYADWIAPESVKLKDVQSQLQDENTLLVEFFLGSKKSYAWVVSSTSITGYELPERKSLEEATLRIKELLMAREPVAGEEPLRYQQRVKDYESRYWTEASVLSRQLFGPMKAVLAGRRLLIVSDGALHYLPFESLPFPHDDKVASESVFLDVSQEVIKLPSAAVLAIARRANTSASRTIAVLADPVFSLDDERLSPNVRPASTAKTTRSVNLTDENSANTVYIDRLPATKREAEEIMKLVPAAEGKLVSGFEANHTFASSPQLSQYRIIHFATHGMINEEHPQLSGIILSLVDRDGRRQDGFLRLHEIYNLKLASDLVVLSACQTGLGKDLKGEGIIGLTRGFMYAGSKSVIATLWKVDEEATTELMKHFYYGLLTKGLTPAAALREAKIAVRSQKRWQSPYFWAAFELHGEYAKRIETRNNYYLIVLALILICPVAIYYGWKRLRRQSLK